MKYKGETEGQRVFVEYFSHPEVVVFDEQPGASSSSSCAQGPSGLPIARLSNRLSSSVGEVLHETSDVEDHLDLEVLRPLTACAGDAGRSLSCLDWVHENQARRMKSRSDWFLSPFINQKRTTVSKSIDFVGSSSTSGGRDWTSTGENAPLLDNEELPATEEEEPTLERKPSEKKEQRPPLVDRKNSLKEKNSRQNVTRQLSGCNVNIAGFTAPASQSSPSTAITRRRSWRMRCAQGDAPGATKTHSLDSPYHPCDVEESSIKLEDWKATGGEDVPPKRRSLKKKHTALF